MPLSCGAPRWIRRKLAPTVVLALLLPATGATQLARFQGTWFASGSDSAMDRTVRVRDLLVRMREPCAPPESGMCEFEGTATPYSPLGAPRGDSTVTTLVVELRRGELRRLMVLSIGERGMHATTYTQFPTSAGLGNIVERQFLAPPATANGGSLPAMPQFPWPPPPPTASLGLPAGLVGAPGDSLGTVFDRIRAALGRVDVGWWSVYAIGDSGFAVVTRMEAIEPDGRPKAPPNRWLTPLDRPAPRFTSIADYLRALFTARPGHYRIIVLAVTARVLTTSGVTLTADSASHLLAGGSDALPGWLRRRPLPPDGRGIALIYEFARPTESDTVAFVANSRATIVQHLVQAGLWTQTELRP